MDSPEFDNLLVRHALLKEGDAVIVGYSTGPDSTALLSLLAASRLELRLIAVYVDHGLRPHEALRERELAGQVCRQMNIPCESIERDARAHKLRHGMSLEESCRLLRYAALEECRLRHQAAAIAVAHTADDQAEEILLRLFRGTGLKGLSGMAMKSGRIIRPLLQCGKQELLDLLAQQGLPYCIDSSNADHSFLRNRMRLDLLPRIRESFNPAIRQTLLNTADILREENDLLDELSAEAFNLCVEIEERIGKTTAMLALETFLHQHVAIRRRIVETLCWRFGTPPTFAHVDRLIKLASHGRNGSQVHLPSGLRVVKSRSQLVFQQPRGRCSFRGDQPPPSYMPCEIAAPGSYRHPELHYELDIQRLGQAPARLLPGELLADAAKLPFPLVLRAAERGERFIPLGMREAKKVTRFLADRKIPRHERYRHAVLAAGETVVAVLALQIDQRFAIDASTTDFVKISWRPAQGEHG